jgi:hypothetical protein
MEAKLAHTRDNVHTNGIRLRPGQPEVLWYFGSCVSAVTVSLSGPRKLFKGAFLPVLRTCVCLLLQDL